MHVKRLAIYTIIVLGLLTRTALAECTLNKDYTFPLTISLPTQDRIFKSYTSGVGTGRISLTEVSSALGVGLTTSLATCTSGETLIMENNEVALSGKYYFQTSSKSFKISYNIEGASKKIIIPENGISVTLSTSGRYTLNSIFDTFSSTGRTFSYNWSTGNDTDSGGEIVQSALALRLITSDGKELLRVYYDAFKVIVGTCRVSTWDKEVDFGTVPTRTLKVAGSTGKEASFNINLYCSSTKRRPSITFEGRTDSAYTTVFTNPSGDEYAQGVGVQLLKDGNVITPGEKVSLKVLNPGYKDYEFSSRVFRLNRELTVGAIDVPVTFTMTYE